MTLNVRLVFETEEVEGEKILSLYRR